MGEWAGGRLRFGKGARRGVFGRRAQMAELTFSKHRDWGWDEETELGQTGGIMHLVLQVCWWKGLVKFLFKS